MWDTISPKGEGEAIPSPFEERARVKGQILPNQKVPGSKIINYTNSNQKLFVNIGR